MNTQGAQDWSWQGDSIRPPQETEESIRCGRQGCHLNLDATWPVRTVARRAGQARWDTEACVPTCVTTCGSQARRTDEATPRRGSRLPPAVCLQVRFLPTHGRSPEQHATQATLDPGEAAGLTAGCVSRGREWRWPSHFPAFRSTSDSSPPCSSGVPTLLRCEDGWTGR